MRSLSGSTLTPISVTTWPLTLTRPWAMSASAPRLEAKPRSARTFCRRVRAMALPEWEEGVQAEVGAKGVQAHVGTAAGGVEAEVVAVLVPELAVAEGRMHDRLQLQGQPARGLPARPKADVGAGDRGHVGRAAGVEVAQAYLHAHGHIDAEAGGVLGADDVPLPSQGSLQEQQADVLRGVDGAGAGAGGNQPAVVARAFEVAQAEVEVAPARLQVAVELRVEVMGDAIVAAAT